MKGRREARRREEERKGKEGEKKGEEGMRGEPGEHSRFSDRLTPLK